MATIKQIEDAQYLYCGNDSKMADGIGQCGFICVHSVMVNNDIDSKRPSYRYCKKLNMPVGTFDHCKYFKDKDYSALIGAFFGL